MPKSSPIRQLTNAVFGFALSVGALSLTSANPQTALDIVGGLLLFSLSFTILVVIWWGTSDLMSMLDQEKTRTILLNILLLFFVAIEPYLLTITSVNMALFPLSSTLYAIDMAVLMGILTALGHILIKENKETLTPEQLNYYRMYNNKQYVVTALFSLSALPMIAEWAVGGFSVRSIIWLFTLALSVAAPPRKKNIGSTKAHDE